MGDIYSRLGLIDTHCKVYRNIVSIRESQDLFDDLSTAPTEWALAQRVEDEVRPAAYRSHTPIIHRPFEDAEWLNAIGWPFENKQASRFSDGAFGVWYGGDAIETSVYETVYHWYRHFLTDAGFEKEPVIGERKVYDVTCDAALVDLRPHISVYPELIHRTDYSSTQSIGAKFHREGHPGLITKSVRYPTGDSYVILNHGVLSQPKTHCYLTYRMVGQKIQIEKEPTVVWLEIAKDSI